MLMSTTTREADSLSDTFAHNCGADGVTQVFSGSVQFQTDGVLRGNGLPHEFDYVVEFDTPYVYDPQKGNLLLDMASPTDIGTAFLWTDGDLRTVAHVLALSEGAQTGVPGPGEFVTQFMIVPEPSSWLSSLVAVAIFLLVTTRAYF
jgi:hypothetical protein